MGGPPDIRASDAEREQAIDRLRDAAVRVRSGRLRGRLAERWLGA